MNIGKQLKEGLLTRNPVAVRLTGLCVALAVTTDLLNGLGMGLCVLVVLTLTNGLLSILGPYLPKGVRTISALAVIATLGAMADLLVQAFFPQLAGDLGLFLPLLAVTCVLLSGAGAYAYENTVGLSVLEGFCQGLGYTLVLVLIGMLRELLGKGSFGGGLLNAGVGLQVFPSRFAAGGLTGPVGGFLALACVIAIIQALVARPKKSRRKEEGKKR